MRSILGQNIAIRSAWCLAVIVSALFAFFFIAYDVFPYGYWKYGMYTLIIQKACPLINQAVVVVCFVFFLTWLEFCILKITKKKRWAINFRIGSPIAALLLVYLLYGGFWVNRNLLPDFYSLRSFLGNIVFVVSAGFLFFIFSVIGNNRLVVIFNKGILKLLALMLVLIFIAINLMVYCWNPLITAEGPNVVFIGVDTLRADHLSCYGYERETTPHIDSWAQSATIFNQCIASTPRTTQSLASIFTSQYPHNTGVRGLFDRLPDEKLTIAEILKNYGYKTIAIIATGIPYKKLDAGFDVVINASWEWEAQVAVEKTLAQLSLVDEKYFLFVFFRDPHMPYKLRCIEYDTGYDVESRDEINYFPEKGRCVFKNNYSDLQREHAIALYDSEICNVDKQFETLLKAIKKKNEDNIILFFSDHGESLGEHDFYYDHGDLLYQPSLRIPFIIEGVPFEEKRIFETVRTIDFLPTVLGHVGIKIKNSPFEGVDLRKKIDNLEAYSETGRVLVDEAYETKRRHVEGLRGRLRSLTMDNKKVIYVPKQSGIDFEFYDLNTDPEELSDLANAVDFEEMKRKILDWVEQDKSNWEMEEKSFDDTARQRLKSLGYL